ncbi:hypothetical protein EYR41_006080 [Orbilia oligospora]|uniref:Uncharacterized protein n=1 Tax=Orbilia oligospora TaxID=2813651 RepID=A0A8H2E3G7_ORBOL|nr:hypothetical protein EYR41_006080 [Orbilia oligospora]
MNLTLAERTEETFEESSLRFQVFQCYSRQKCFVLENSRQKALEDLFLGPKAKFQKYKACYSSMINAREYDRFWYSKSGRKLIWELGRDGCASCKSKMQDCNVSSYKVPYQWSNIDIENPEGLPECDSCRASDGDARCWWEGGTISALSTVEKCFRSYIVQEWIEKHKSAGLLDTSLPPNTLGPDLRSIWAKLDCHDFEDANPRLANSLRKFEGKVYLVEWCFQGSDFITWEPPGVVTYDNKIIDQFLRGVKDRVFQKIAIEGRIYYWNFDVKIDPKMLLELYPSPYV